MKSQCTNHDGAAVKMWWLDHNFMTFQDLTHHDMHKKVVNAQNMYSLSQDLTPFFLRCCEQTK